MPLSGNKNKKNTKQKKSHQPPKAGTLHHQPNNRRQMKKEITAAVNSLPELVSQKVNLDSTFFETPTADSAENKKSFTNHEPPRYSGLLMWAGVGVITAVVFAMWFFNTTTLFSDFTKKDYKNSELWSTATADLDKIIESIGQNNTTTTTSPADDRQVNLEVTTREKIKASLAAILADSRVNSTTTSN
jgi:hypothetical protein